MGWLGDPFEILLVHIAGQNQASLKECTAQTHVKGIAKTTPGT